MSMNVNGFGSDSCSRTMSGRRRGYAIAFPSFAQSGCVRMDMDERPDDDSGRYAPPRSRRWTEESIGHALLTERVRQIPTTTAAAFWGAKLVPQRFGLFLRELEHEVFRKAATLR